MTNNRIAVIAAISLALSACESDEKVTVAGQEVTQAAAEFMKASNGNWNNTQHGLHVYISSGFITVTKIKDGKAQGYMAGYYRPDMKPDTREMIEVDQVNEALSGIKKAALISNDDKIILELQGRAYPLTREKTQPSRKTSPVDKTEAKGDQETKQVNSK